MGRPDYGTEKWTSPNYSQIREEAECDERETASERHNFSLVPIGIAIAFTAVLIYALLVVRHFRSNPDKGFW